jgi:hypothetical protein
MNKQIPLTQRGNMRGNLRETLAQNLVMKVFEHGLSGKS